MKSVIKNLKIQTDDGIQVIDICDRVKSALSESGIRDGSLTIITQHTTTAININEREEGLQRDMVEFLSKVVPADAVYIHNRNAADGRANAHSHLMTLFANASETIPVIDGQMALGKWQSIFFIELDGPRDERTVKLHIRGE